MKGPIDRQPRYLIGQGEKLTVTTDAVFGPPGDKVLPYKPDVAAARLRPRLAATVAAVDALPVSACPGNKAVALVTMHHEFLAKSFFPAKLFAEFSLEAIGSRARQILPEAWGKRPKKMSADTVPETIELYVAGRRENLSGWARSLGQSHAEELVRIEDIRPLSALDQTRVRAVTRTGSQLLEVALHSEGFSMESILAYFSRHVAPLGGKVDVGFALETPGLIFVPLEIAAEALAEVARFSFLRTIRPITQLRTFPEAVPTRSAGQRYRLVSPGPLNPAMRIAVIDGGLPSNHGLPGVQHFDALNLGPAAPRYLDHGLGVTGACLWGPIDPGGTLPAPYCSIDHYRVLDQNDVGGAADRNAFAVLRRVREVVETGSYDIINLSLGPNAPVDDGEVNVWTSTLDDLAADGQRLIVVAAGNNGEDPHPVCRVQAPSDGVNCFGVGASDRRAGAWKRASYSAKGPGRRPGLKKPDILAFGGSHEDALHVLRLRGGGYVLAEEMGTSFSAGLITRTATGVRAAFGSPLQPLTLKCLMVHTADPGIHDETEVGWGHVRPERQIITCPPGTARVVYQGQLNPRKFLRAKLPIPPGLDGEVKITATLCYATPVSAADPINYTNSGVSIRFRPDSTKFNEDENGKPGAYPATAKFFQEGAYATEADARTLERKWETVLHASHSKRASGLHEPFFDLHFIPRLGAGDHPNPAPIRYAMVITVESKRHPDLYDRVLKAFPKLQALTPIMIPSAPLSSS
jgi:subtilisin family serine protease